MNKIGGPDAAELATFTRIVRAALGPRARVARDAEGWPVAPGRRGRLEWRGAEADGGARCYAFTTRFRLIPKLLGVPGVRPAQVGSDEAAVWMRHDDVAAIRAVAALLRTRVRRAPESGQSAAFLARIRLRRGAG